MDEGKLFERVLLVEDEPAHATLIRRALRPYAGVIEHRDSLAAALEAVPQLRPDLIITDLNLSDSGGLSNLRKLVELDALTPVVVLTSSTSLSDAVEAMKLGARDFIVKNFDADFGEMLGLSLARVQTALAVEQERRKLMRDMQVLQGAIQNSADGLAVVSGAGTIVYQNSAFETFVRRCEGTLTGVDRLIGESVARADNVRAQLIDKFQHLPAGAVWNTEIEFVQDKVHAFDLSLSTVGPSSQLLSSPPDMGRSSVLWVRDISEQKRRERFQREILSTTTHDLKGPLGAISISADLLADLVRDNSKVYNLVMRVGSAAQSAINMIDEFLSARRIQEGTFILKPSRHLIATLSEECMAAFKTMAQAKSVELTSHIIPQDLAWFLDGLAFQRVLGNLLSNAIKFTPKSGRVEVWLEARGEELRMAVTDTGCGMEPSEVNKIFERFTRLERHRDIPGSGLGLFVVKSVIEAHGGKVAVTSRLGEGTTFELSFPAQPPVNERGELISLGFT